MLICFCIIGCIKQVLAARDSKKNTCVAIQRELQQVRVLLALLRPAPQGRQCQNDEIHCNSLCIFVVMAYQSRSFFAHYPAVRFMPVFGRTQTGRVRLPSAPSRQAIFDNGATMLQLKYVHRNTHTVQISILLNLPQ